MCIISITEETYDGGQKFAETLAKELGLHYVDTAILIERATAWGAKQEELRDALNSTPTFLDRFTHHLHSQVLLLQAALGEEVREGNAVCYGVAGDLLNFEAGQILRIHVDASHSFRRLQVQEDLGLCHGEGERRIGKCDRDQQRWQSYLLRNKLKSSSRHDLAINFERTELAEACATIQDLIAHQSRFTSDAAFIKSIECFAVSSRIQAALANDPDTSHLNIHVEIKGDTALLRGLVHCFQEIVAVKRVALTIPSVTTVDVSDVQLVGGQEFAPVFFTDPLAGPLPKNKYTFWMSAISWTGGALATVSVVVVLLNLTPVGPMFTRRWLPSETTPLQSFAGLVTDSHCGLSKVGLLRTKDCVQSCIKTGAKYVLNDGTHLYLLSDQSAAEMFAAQRVVVTGTLDKNRVILRVRSIQAMRAQTSSAPKHQLTPRQTDEQKEGIVRWPVPTTPKVSVLLSGNAA